MEENKAKIFLNRLYGKTASNTDSSFKYAYMNNANNVGFIEVNTNDKAGYFAVGRAITRYAQPGFIYADTDSIHCDKGV